MKFFYGYIAIFIVEIINRDNFFITTEIFIPITVGGGIRIFADAKSFIKFRRR